MAECLEDLLDDFGGMQEVNHLWQQVSDGNDFINPTLYGVIGSTVEVEMDGPDGAAEVVLLATAHTSRRSAERAAQLVQHFRPDCLVLERCAERLETLAWPKELVMDASRSERLAQVRDKNLDVMQVYALRPKLGEDVAVTAGKLWTRFQVLNADKNGMVEEAAFDEFAIQTLASGHGAPALLCLGDMPVHMSQLGSGSEVTTKALLNSLPDRDAYLADAVRTAVGWGRARRVLVLLGAQHLDGVSARLQNAGPVPVYPFGAEEARGGFLDARAVQEIWEARGRIKKRVKELLTAAAADGVSKAAVAQLLDEFNEGVVSPELFQRLLSCGMAADSCGSDAVSWGSWWANRSLVGGSMGMFGGRSAL